jgi:hypothetical protein
MSHTRQQRIRLLMLALGALLPASCRSPAPELAGGGMPADFAIEFYVQAQAHEVDPRQRTGRFIVEPDRRLRGIQHDLVEPFTFPPTVRTLTPREMEALVDLVRRHRLMSEPTSPLAEQAVADPRSNRHTLYRVTITAWGRTNRFVTTAEESPPTAELLSALTALAEPVRAP